MFANIDPPQILCSNPTNPVPASLASPQPFQLFFPPFLVSTKNQINFNGGYYLLVHSLSF